MKVEDGLSVSNCKVHALKMLMSFVLMQAFSYSQEFCILFLFFYQVCSEHSSSVLHVSVRELWHGMAEGR